MLQGGAIYEKMMLETVKKMTEVMPVTRGDGSVRDAVVHDSMNGMAGKRKN